ncbi:MAG: DNA polymerase I, partial [Candidatus Zixiibacteriota bacterium]
MKGKSLFLVDGSAIFYRAHFAFIRNPLINSKGENTSATFGFVSSLLKIIREENPDYIGVIFDTKAPTFRHKMYPEYKSTRAKMPEELVLQVPRIKEATEALNLPSLELEGYEADDIIGTLAAEADERGMNVWIVSGDKDMFQLVTDRINVYNPQKGSLPPVKLDKKGVEEKFGVPPEKVADALALMGDASDNVPGVPGIGPKTALSLLEEFGTLDSILKSHDKIKAKGVRKKIGENIEGAELSRKLVTIDKSAPIELSLEQLKRGEVDFEKAKKFFLEMEFVRLLDELARQSGVLDLKLDDSPKAVTSAERGVRYTCVESIDRLEKLIAELRGKKEVAVDTETTSLYPLQADLVGVSLCAEAGRAYYIPLGHDDKKRNLPGDEAIGLLSTL